MNFNLEEIVIYILRNFTEFIIFVIIDTDKGV